MRNMQLQHLLSAITAAASLLAGQAASAPVPTPRAAPVFRREAMAASMVQQIMPSSGSCGGATSDCRTAAQAAPYLIQAFSDYGLYAPGQIAGVLALVGYESDDLKYKHNISPGRPGQGTANMQMANYNLMYAQSVAALKGQADAVGTSTAAMSDDQLNDVLALVTPDQYNFASGAWFLSTQCSSDVQSQLATGTDPGFEAYMGCVGATIDDGRKAYWTRAKAAFGISS